MWILWPHQPHDFLSPNRGRGREEVRKVRSVCYSGAALSGPDEDHTVHEHWLLCSTQFHLWRGRKQFGYQETSLLAQKPKKTPWRLLWSSLLSCPSEDINLWNLHGSWTTGGWKRWAPARRRTPSQPPTRITSSPGGLQRQALARPSNWFSSHLPYILCSSQAVFSCSSPSLEPSLLGPLGLQFCSEVLQSFPLLLCPYNMW